MPAELAGSDSALLFEQAAEVQRVLVTDDFSDLRDIAGGGLQQALGIGDPEGEEVLHGCRTGIVPETPDKPADAHAPASGVFFNANGMVVAGMEMGDGQVHLVNEKNILAPGLFFLKPADHHKQQFKIIHKNRLVVRLGELQLLNHVQVNLLII